MGRNEDQIKKIIQKIESIKKEVLSQKNMQAIADSVADSIKLRTRSGKGVDEQGNLTKLDPLSDEYVETRKRKRNKLSPYATPKKSNLTATGQMLDSIDTAINGSSIIFFFKEQRTKELSGKSKSTNGQIAKYVEDGGRRFFGFSKFDKQMVLRQLRKIISDAIDKN